MSSFFASRTALRHISAAAGRATASSAAGSRHNTTRRCMSTMHDNDPETLETEKRRNLSNQQHKTSTPHPSAPGWNEHLASASEASVKADRSASASTDDLQAQTVEYVTARHTPDDRMSPTTAFYSRDEVSGPLGSAPGHEDTQGVYKTIVKKVHEKTTEILENDTPPKGYS